MAAPLLLPLLLLAMFSGSDAAFCLCRQGASDAAIQTAIDYACGKGADCSLTKQGGPCSGNGNKAYVCSYICNSYYQSRVSMGATCDFGGVAALSNTDLSSGSCKFASSPSSVGTGGTGAGTGGMGTGAGTGAGTGMGAGTGTNTGAGTGTGAGAGITTPGSGLSPPFGGTGAYGPSGAGSTDYNAATAPTVSARRVVAALALAVVAPFFLR